MPTQNTRVESLVREYPNATAYAKDAERLAREGWTPVNTVEKRGGLRWIPGIIGMLFFILPGVLILLFARKSKLVVTYTRTQPVGSAGG